MTVTTMTLTDFLLARIAEDEEFAKFSPDRWGPNRRAAAECEAKRRIVEMHSGPDYWESPDYHLCVDSMTHNEQCDTLRALALPYADHPDWREEWA